MIDFINKITKSLDWGEIAGILAITIFLWTVLKWLAHLIIERVKSRWRVRENPLISIPTQNLPVEDVQLIVRTFDKNRDRKTSRFENWKKYEDFEIKPEGNTYKIRKNDILGKMLHSNYAFKFFLRVPEKERMKYYSILLDNHLVVTGAGDRDVEHEGKWRIWFLEPHEKLHMDLPTLWHMNHQL